MIQQIKWASRGLNEPGNPFSRGGTDRPIRITFHSSSFGVADEEQLGAIELLRELTKLTLVEAIDTEPGPLPHLEIGDCGEGSSTIPITVTDGGHCKRRSRIQAPDNLFEAFVSLVEQSRTENFNRQAAFRDFLIARANHHLDYDILITLSPYLLANRENPWVRSVNPRSPVEAVRIIGLLLRTRGGYVFEVKPNYFFEMDRRSIYKQLLRHKLPSMSRYIKACEYAEALGAHGSAYLAESALVRCARALQARDEIGGLFYTPQSNNSRDAIMYHFDYLTLLLAGAFDAQARVARLVYRMNDVNEKNAGFHFKDFRKALKKTRALELYNRISGQHFFDLMTLLHEPRNSIHAAIWPTIARAMYTEPEESFIKVPPPYQDKIWAAALRCDSPDEWGLVQCNEFSMLLLEPYSYALNLVEQCFREIDEIATVTDITSLLPSHFDMTQLRDNSPYDDVFVEWVRHRVAILG